MSNEMDRNLSVPPPIPERESQTVQNLFDNLHSWLAKKGEANNQAPAAIKDFCFNQLPTIMQDSTTIGLSAITEEGRHYIILHLPVRGYAENVAKNLPNTKAGEASKQFDKDVAKPQRGPKLDIQLLFHVLDDDAPHEPQLNEVLNNYTPQTENPNDFMAVGDWGEPFGVLTIPYQKA